MTSLLVGLFLITGSLTSPEPTLDDRLGTPHLVEVEHGRRLNFFCIGEGSPVGIAKRGHGGGGRGLPVTIE